MSLRIASFEYTERFKRDFKALPADMQAAATSALEALKQTPIPKTLRHHVLCNYKPKIHKIDIVSNHGYQVTFEVNGSVAKLLRVSTHKHIDRAPK